MDPDPNLSDVRLLAWRVGRLESQVTEGFHSMSLQMSNALVSKEVYEVRHMAMLERIHALEAVNDARKRDRLTVGLSLTGSFMALLAITADILIHVAG